MRLKKLFPLISLKFDIFNINKFKFYELKGKINTKKFKAI